MSSKDLQGLRLLKSFIDEGIDSLKIEGRMKSHLYAGTMSKIALYDAITSPRSAGLRTASSARHSSG